MNRQNARIAQYGDMTDAEIMEGFVNRYVVTGLVRNEGTIVVFEALPVGVVGSENLIRFAADHRPAVAILAAMAAGEDVEVELEGWQILGGRRRPVLDTATSGGISDWLSDHGVPEDAR